MMAALLLTSMLLLVVPSVMPGESSGFGCFTLTCYPNQVPLVSGILNVTVVAKSASKSQVDREKLHDVHLGIMVKRDGITPEYQDTVLTVDSDAKTHSYSKITQVTFRASSTVPLQEHPIHVTILAILENTILNVTANITDNRVEIGFLSQSEPIRTCYPNKSCDLSLEVSRNTSFVMTVSLVNSKNKTVDHTSFAVRSDGDRHVQITAPEVGVFTAILSVPKEMESSVVWTRRSLLVYVVEDQVANLTSENRTLQVQYHKLKIQFQELEEKYSTLERIVHKLETHVSACDGVTCSESHTCKDGKCVCIEEEDDCHDYAPCDYCWSRGLCEGSLDNKRDYTCKCHNQDVTGKNCSDCKDDYCSGHGVCTVSDDGQPYCECYEPFIGPKCEGCNDTSCNGRGICTVNEDGKPTCLAVSAPLPTPLCDPPCQSGQTCTLKDDNNFECVCLNGFSGDSCEYEGNHDNDKDEQTDTVPSSAPSPESNSNLLYGGLAVFIALLVICVAAYLAYHYREKIYELSGVKRKTIVETAMRSRTYKNKGYKKLPTSIHDTL